MKVRSYAAGIIGVCAVLVVVYLLVTQTTILVTTSTTTSSTGTTTQTPPSSSSTTSSTTTSSTILTSTTTTSVTSTSSPSGNIFSFQPPQLTGGDGPVTGSDFAAHAGDTDEWLEAKIVPTGMNGWIWYIHADFVGATNSIGGVWANVTTDSDASTYPQGVASYDIQTHLLIFKVTSLPTGENGWYHNAKVGDVIECYPFSSQAFWSAGSNFYWSGNCELLTGGNVLTGVGHFIRTWQGGSGINGNPIPTCYPQTEFEGVFSIVFTGGTIDITDLLCASEPRYQVGGILWFDTGAFENVGAQEGKQMITYSTNKGCKVVSIAIPTSRGILNASVSMDRYYLSGCAGEDASLSGTLNVSGTSYQILGVMSEFRCTSGYC